MNFSAENDDAILVEVAEVARKLQNPERLPPPAPFSTVEAALFNLAKTSPGAREHIAIASGTESNARDAIRSLRWLAVELYSAARESSTVTGYSIPLTEWTGRPPPHPPTSST